MLSRAHDKNVINEPSYIISAGLLLDCRHRSEGQSASKLEIAHPPLLCRESVAGIQHVIIFWNDTYLVIGLYIPW